MGEALTDEMMLKVNETVLSVPGVIGFHDLMVHDYQSRKVVSLHIEVKASLTAAQAHGIADKVEGKLKELMGPESEVTAHVDPRFKNR
jgi:divalent metal cation (Fe/Co/Zn/Cd) transporter